MKDIDLDAYNRTPEELKSFREIEEMLHNLNPYMFPKKVKKWRVALSGGPWDGKVVRVRSLAGRVVAPCPEDPRYPGNWDCYGYTGILDGPMIAFAMWEPMMHERGWRSINQPGHPNFRVP